MNVFEFLGTPFFPLLEMIKWSQCEDTLACPNFWRLVGGHYDSLCCSCAEDEDMSLGEIQKPLFMLWMSSPGPVGETEVQSCPEVNLINGRISFRCVLCRIPIVAYTTYV